MRLCSLGEIGHLRLARTRGMGRNILFSWDGLMGVQRVTPAANAKMTSRSLQRFRKAGVGLEMSLCEKSCLVASCLYGCFSRALYLGVGPRKIGGTPDLIIGGGLMPGSETEQRLEGGHG